MAALTPFQTVGPYLSIGLRAGLTAVPHPTIVIRGRLVDGAGAGISDGVLEFWHPSLPEVQRAMTDPNGEFSVTTIKPLAIAGPGGQDQAPHLALRVLGRGILTQVLTRIYFGEEPANETDPILMLVPEERRTTLIAQPLTANVYRFDVIVQGEGETVFFDI